MILHRLCQTRSAIALASLWAWASATSAEEPTLPEVFRQECTAKAEAATSATIPGEDGWHFFKDELSHVAAGPFWAPADVARISPRAAQQGRSPLTAITDLDRQLKSRGITLIVVPAPLKAFVYPDELSGRIPFGEGKAPQRLDVHQQRFYALLKERGVTVVDVVPALLRHRLDPEGLMYCKTDTHWTSIACIHVARQIAAELSSKPWIKGVRKTKYETARQTREIEGDFQYLVGRDEAKPAPETVPVRMVGIRTETGLTPVGSDPLSPVVLMTDSYGKVFHTGGEDEHGTGAGLPDQLAAELGFPVELLASSGSAIRSVRVALRRRISRDPKYLPGKKAIIWCFASRYLSTVADEWSRVAILP